MGKLLFALIVTLLLSSVLCPPGAFSEEHPLSPKGASPQGYGASSVAETPEAIARRLQQNYDQITSLKFQFVQKTAGELSGRPQEGRGTALFVKDKKEQGRVATVGKMRWDYSSPEQQVLVSDGVNFSMYFAKLNQMIISPATAMQSDITYSFFTGSGDLLTDFIVSAANPEYAAASMGSKDGTQGHQTQVIQLTPRENQSQVSTIHLWVSTNSLIQRMEILDYFDTHTSLEFSDIQVDSLNTSDRKAMDALFRFTPPEGTEMIYQ